MGRGIAAPAGRMPPGLLCCAAAPSGVLCLVHPSLATMINVVLALVPLAFATGSLVWTMTSGARAQARSDEWAAQWMKDNA